MTNFIYQNDLPNDLELLGDLAVDSETLGLNLQRDRLCVVQISNGDGNAHLVQFDGRNYMDAKNLIALLSDESRQKIFHYARFDVAMIYQHFDIMIENTYCTKIASKLARTYTDSHGLKALCKELLDIDISKQQQSSNWAEPKLSKAQIDYAASDVLYLHALRDKLNAMLKHVDRKLIAETCHAFIAARVALDLGGFENTDIFAHH